MKHVLIARRFGKILRITLDLDAPPKGGVVSGTVAKIEEIDTADLFLDGPPVTITADEFLDQ